MKTMITRRYTAAQSAPMVSGLQYNISDIQSGRSAEVNVHLDFLSLTHISPFQSSMYEGRAEPSYETECK